MDVLIRNSFTIALLLFVLLFPSVAGDREEVSPFPSTHAEYAESVPAVAVEEEDGFQETSEGRDVDAAESTPEPVTSEPEDEWETYTATFYTLAEGSGTGLTKSGTVPTAGRTLAVDPSLIPLGSIVQIKYPDGAVETRVAEDTGGAIQGRILDVYVVTVEEALNRGRQEVKVKVIN